MTPDDYETRSCRSKVPFESRKAARQRATPQMSRLGGGKVAPYRCKFAAHWHIGHTTPKNQRRRDAA